MARHRRALIAALILLGLTAVALAQAPRGGTRWNTSFARNFDPQTLNPLGTSVDNGSIFAMHQIYDTLVGRHRAALDQTSQTRGKCPLMERRGHSICARRVSRMVIQ